MNDKFSFSVDRSLGLVRISMSGLLTLGDVGDFYEMRRQAHDALGWPKNAHMTLNDVRQVNILPQQTLVAICEMLADPAYHSRRLAFVVSPTLVRAQVVRALGARANARCFNDPAEAEAWLLEDEACRAPQPRTAIGR